MNGAAIPIAAKDPRSKGPKAAKGSATTRVKLCVAIQPSQAGIEHGQVAQWVIGAWTEGGNVPAATIRLAAVPGSLTPRFSFGCGSHDGTPSCYLGAMDAKSSQRQLQARVTVPASATTVTAVRLIVIGSAAHLPTDPRAAATVSVNAGVAAGSGGTPVVSTSPLAVGSLPYLNGSAPSPTLSPGGNAAGLFPTINPSSGSGSPSGSPSATPGPQNASAKTVANTSALPLGAPLVGAQLVGLGVLALAFVLAVTRLSIRRRPVPASAAAAAAPAAGKGGSPGSDAKASDDKGTDGKPVDGEDKDSGAADSEDKDSKAATDDQAEQADKPAQDTPEG